MLFIAIVPHRTVIAKCFFGSWPKKCFDKLYQRDRSKERQLRWFDHPDRYCPKIKKTDTILYKINRNIPLINSSTWLVIDWYTIIPQPILALFSRQILIHFSSSFVGCRWISPGFGPHPLRNPIFSQHGFFRFSVLFLHID